VLKNIKIYENGNLKDILKLDLLISNLKQQNLRLVIDLDESLII